MTALADFPAAHSMDTTWFAVDQDGHVAVFESGEPGAAPLVAQHQLLSARLDALRPTGAPCYLLPSPTLPGEDVHAVSPRSLRPALFLLRSAATLDDEIAAGRARREASLGGEAVRVEAVTSDLIERLHASGDCLGCRPLGEDSPAALGIYEYEHPSAFAAPYRLTVKPSLPLRVDALPPDAQQHLVLFPGRFEQTPLLQPVAHWPCDSWDAIWLDTDLRTVRAIPGREDALAEASDSLQDFPGLQLDPAPFPLPAAAMTSPSSSSSTAQAPAPGAPDRARSDSSASSTPPSAPRKTWWRRW